MKLLRACGGPPFKLLRNCDGTKLLRGCDGCPDGCLDIYSLSLDYEEFQSSSTCSGSPEYSATLTDSGYRYPSCSTIWSNDAAPAIGYTLTVERVGSDWYFYVVVAATPYAVGVKTGGDCPNGSYTSTGCQDIGGGWSIRGTNVVVS